MRGITHYEPGESVESYLLIKSATKSIAVNGNPYLTLILQDKSGDIEAKLWDAKEETAKQYQPQTIVKVAGEIQNYRGRMQLKIRQIRPAGPQDGKQISEFIETAPLDQTEMADTINQFIFDMKNPNVQRITRFLLNKYHSEFLEYPAATKNHHEFVSGLAYHVVSMLQLAKSIADLYPSLDRDLLYAGVILHDLGKVIELSGPISTAYTVEGNLLGHITIMVNEIGKAAEELQIEGE